MLVGYNSKLSDGSVLLKKRAVEVICYPESTIVYTLANRVRLYVTRAVKVTCYPESYIIQFTIERIET